MTTNRAQKIKAFKRLFGIAQSGSVDLCEYIADYHKGDRRWPIEWDRYLKDGHFENQQDQQKALDNVLDCFVTRADLPSSPEELQKQREVIRLALDAGADPNRGHYYSYGFGERIFDVCIGFRKYYAALEIAKSPDFHSVCDLETDYQRLSDGLSYYLEHGRHYPRETFEQDRISEINLNDKKDLVYVLFQKNMFPQDNKIFEKLVPIVLEKDPKFFQKKKQRVVTQLKSAKTPVQIFNALTGRKGGRK